jgi:hypothetical protein
MLTNLLSEQANSSLLEVFGGQQFLLKNGIFTDAAVDTLLGYAYMQPGVLNVNLKVDLDEQNEGKSPSVTYFIKTTKSYQYKAKAMKTLISYGITGKLLALLLAKFFKAPAPGLLESQVKAFAKAFLPEPYQIHIKLNETAV